MCRPDKLQTSRRGNFEVKPCHESRKAASLRRCPKHRGCSRESGFGRSTKLLYISRMISTGIKSAEVGFGCRLGARHCCIAWKLWLGSFELGEGAETNAASKQAFESASPPEMQRKEAWISVCALSTVYILVRSSSSMRVGYVCANSEHTFFVSSLRTREEA